MDFKLNEDQEMLRKAARSFAEEYLAEHVPTIEEKDEMPASVIKEAAARDFMGVTIPEEYGGIAMGNLARMILLEEISRVSASLGMLMQVWHLGIHPIARFGSEEQKQKYLPSLATGEVLAGLAVTESTGGSDPGAMQTEAVKDGDHYILNGRKVYITSSHLSKVVGVLAKMAEQPDQFTLFLLDEDCPGWKPGRQEKKLGFKGSNTGDLIMEDCRVPASNIIGNIGDGLKIGLNSIAEIGRAGMAGVSLGILAASIEAAVKFANERTMGGKPIAKLQAIQFKIAEMYMDLEISRLLAYKAAALADAGVRCDTEMSMAKYYSSEASVRCAKAACDIYGGLGYMMETPTQRYLRDAFLTISSAGTTEIQQTVIGRAAIKLYS